MIRPRYASLYERLVANTRVEGECWLWTGGIGTNKRPQLSIRRNGKHCTCNAAREMLNLFYVLDAEAEASHLCTDSWLCIAPDHLIPETKQQNMARRWGKPLPAGRVWQERCGVERFNTIDDAFNSPSIRSDFTNPLLTTPSIAPTLHPCAERFGAMEIAR